MYKSFNDQSFNVTLTNNIISFEQMGPEHSAKAFLMSTHIELVEKYLSGYLPI